jgi:hypothetical protein
VASDQQRLSDLLTELTANDVSGAMGADSAEALAGSVSAQLDQLVTAVQQLFDAMERLADRLDQIRYGEDGQMVNLGQVDDEPAWTSGRFTVVHWTWYSLSLAALMIAAALAALALSLLIQRSRHPAR